MYFSSTSGDDVDAREDIKKPPQNGQGIGEVLQKQNEKKNRKMALAPCTEGLLPFGSVQT